MPVTLVTKTHSHHWIESHVYSSSSIHWAAARCGSSCCWRQASTERVVCWGLNSQVVKDVNAFPPGSNYRKLYHNMSRAKHPFNSCLAPPCLSRFFRLKLFICCWDSLWQIELLLLLMRRVITSHMELYEPQLLTNALGPVFICRINSLLSRIPFQETLMDFVASP